MKNWQLRWFVLRSDQLFFYKDEEETKPQVRLPNFKDKSLWCLRVWGYSSMPFACYKCRKKKKKMTVSPCSPYKKMCFLAVTVWLILTKLTLSHRESV